MRHTQEDGGRSTPARVASAGAYAGRVLLVAAVYYASGQLGLRLALVEEIVTPLWPSTGIALVAFFLFGPRIWPGVAVPAFAINLPLVSSPWIALGIAAGNTLAPMLAWWVLKATGFRRQLDRTRDALALIGLGALGAMVFSATGGTLLLIASDVIEPDRFLGIWSVWWTGDAMGILAVAPFLFVVWSWRPSGSVRWTRAAEAVALALVIGGVSLLLLRTEQPAWVLIFPALGWASWRFQQRAAGPAAFVAISVASYAAARDAGSFGGGTLLTTMAGLQAFNAAVAFTSFFFAAIVAERERVRRELEHATVVLEDAVGLRTAELAAANELLEAEIAERAEANRALRESEADLRTVFDSASIGMVQCDLQGRIRMANAAFRRLTGLAEDDLRSRSLSSLTTSADRERFDDLFGRMRRGEIAGFEVEQRLDRAEGGDVWVNATVALVRGTGDEPRFVQAALGDLSERKRAESLQRAEQERARLGMYFAEMPAMICITHGPEHSVEFANEAFLKVARASRDVVGTPAREAFPVLDRQGFFDQMDAVLESGEPRTAAEAAVERVSGRGGGVERAYYNVAYQPLVGPDGRVEGILTHGVDVTTAVLARAQIGQSFALLDTLLATAPAGFALFDEDLRVIRVNDRLARVLGVSVDACMGQSPAEAFPSIAPDIEPRLRFVIEQRQPVADVEIAIPSRRNGEARYWSASFYPVRTPDGALLGVGTVMVDISERKRSEILLMSQKEALEAIAREGGLATVLESLAKLVESRCREDVRVAVMVLDEQRRRLRLGAAPSVPEAFGAAIDGLPVDETSGSCAAAAATRKRVVVADIATHPSWSSSRDIALAHGLHAAWSSPIVASDGAVLGTCCMYATQARAPVPPELALLDILTSSAAIAIERDHVEKAREHMRERERRADQELYEREHRIAETLQRSMLPEVLPDVPDIEVAARYIPASGHAEVGGDWYDVFSMRDGRLGIVIGDVAGHGVAAAAAMGQVRVALRAYAMESLSPSESLRRLNGLLLEFQPGSMATLAYAHLDPDTWTVEVARAGHPAPLVASARGVDVVRGAPAPPIGVAPSVEYAESSFSLDPDATLLFYTDGLIERRRESLDEGIERLRTVLESGPEDLEAMCDHVVETMLGESESSDDVALLAVRAVRQSGRPLRLELPAQPARLPAIRRVMGRWLRQNGFADDEAADVTLACAEACANAIQHAYDGREGTLALDASVQDGAVSIRVRDHGSWKPEGEPHEESGRGMRLMRAVMDSVDVVATNEGTEVRMRRRVGALIGHD
ncbi:MAG TPA: SpoIIE family protein phosphatase [Actinomycetota bacterium]